MKKTFARGTHVVRQAGTTAPTSGLASEGRLRDYVDRAMYIDLL